MTKLSLAGQRFGRLTAVERVERKDLQQTSGHTYWTCRCDCGRDCVVRGAKLTAKAQVSCGCARRDPAVRQAATWRTSPRRRKQIALMGAAAAAAARKAKVKETK